MFVRNLLAASFAFLVSSAPAFSASSEIPKDLITLDTHMDTPMNFARPGWDIMDRHSYDEDLSQVDYPRMVEGGLSGGFFAIYTPQGPRTPEGFIAARNAALLRGVEIREMVAKHSDKFALALRADDAERIAKSGKRIVFMSIENSYPLGKDLTLLSAFYTLGVRMAGPVHFTNNDLADSATDPKGPEWHGLSPLGKQFVAEENRLGIIPDASHASDDVFDQMLALSATPIILSHSGVREMFNHPRNIDDARLVKLAAKGGVIQINSLSDYLIKVPEIPERDAALKALQEKDGPMRAMDEAHVKAYVAQRRTIEAKYPIPRATFDDFMGHVLHALKLIGPDHVGIGLDWDGGGGVTGMEDVASVHKITERLAAEGYKADDIRKIWGGNVLRLLRAAEAQAGH
jgi:membrane dipeptidase